MAGETTTTPSIASSILSAFNSTCNFASQLFRGAEAKDTADAGEKIATSNAKAEANKKRMAIATKDALQARLNVADSLQAQASSPNDPYYGRPKEA